MKNINHIHHLAIKMLTRTFAAYIKVVIKYGGFCDTYGRAFEDYLSLLDALSNIRLIDQLIDLPRLKSYLRVISHYLKRHHLITSLSSAHIQLLHGNTSVLN